MIVSEKVRKASDLAWRRVHKILDRGVVTEMQLADYLGYTSAESFRQSRRRNSGLPQEKRSLIAQLLNTPSQEMARRMVSGAPITNDGDPWSDLEAAAELLVEAIERVTSEVPAWAMSDKLRAWKELADSIRS